MTDPLCRSVAVWLRPSLGLLLLITGCAMPPADGEPSGQDQPNDNANSSDNSDPTGSATGDGYWPLQARLAPFDPDFEDLFGDSVSTSGNYVIAGAPLKNALAGTSDIFIRVAGEWRHHDRLEGGPARFPEQGFGTAVAISNTLAFVGAPKFDIEGSFDIQHGSVYVYRNVGPFWEQDQLLTVSDGQDFEHFGSTLALAPDQRRLVVGAPGRARHQGAVYVFTSNGSNWSRETRLTASDGIDNEGFGRAIVTAGQTVVVGAPGQNFGTGAVYVYEQDGTWREAQKLLAPGGTRTDQFGAALALDGDTLIVGAPARKRPGDDLLQAGAIYIYERRDGTWELDQTLVPNDADAGLFGSAVALEDGVLIISLQPDSEAAFYSRDTRSWAEVGRVSSGNTTFVLDSFGNALSLRDGTLVVGSRSADTGGQRAAGAAFVFGESDSTTIPDGVRF